MKGVFCVGIFSLSLACSAVCSGQCTNGFQTQTFNCVYSDQCEDYVTVSIPDGGQYGVTVECGSVDCCGQQFTTCYSNGGNCEPKKLRPREVKERLSELSRTSEVLVADCSGRYGLYELPQRPVVARRTRTLEALNERILR